MGKGRLFLVHWHAEEAGELAAPLLADGWTVDIETADGARACKAILADPPDAVVVSLARMPSHGRETVRAIRNSKAGRDLPVIFLDGQDDAVEKTKTQIKDAQFLAAPALKRALAKFASP